MGPASAERIYYRKWAEPSVDTTDPSHFELKFGDYLLLGYGTTASSILGKGMIGQIDGVFLE